MLLIFSTFYFAVILILCFFFPNTFFVCLSFFALFPCRPHPPFLPVSYCAVHVFSIKKAETKAHQQRLTKTILTSSTRCALFSSILSNIVCVISNYVLPYPVTLIALLPTRGKIIYCFAHWKRTIVYNDTGEFIVLCSRNRMVKCFRDYHNYSDNK